MQYLAAALIIWFAATAASAQSVKVDVELVLLADASGSIDEAEIKLQRQGYADALAHRDVLNAIGDGLYRRIAITYVEWGDEFSQDVVVPWTVIDGPQSAARFNARLLAAPRRAFGYNAIGTAIAFGQALIEGNQIIGTRRVIDFSADSANSWGGVPIAEARAAALAGAITINGLAILCRDPCNGRPVGYDVEQAFQRQIIGGPGSFVITVTQNRSFPKAVLRKFLLEIAMAPGG